MDAAKNLAKDASWRTVRVGSPMQQPYAKTKTTEEQDVLSTTQ